MLAPSDYKELLSILNKHRVKYLIVGAYAVIHYTEPRYTKDIDIWVKPEIKNAHKVYAALKEFGAPLKRVGVEDFVNKPMVYQIGVAPVRVDVLMGIGEMDFDKAYKHRKVVSLGGVKAHLMGISELIAAKEKAKRPMDEIDVERLRLRTKVK